MTKQVELRFYGELNDFLRYERTTGTVRRSFDVAGSVKDMVEACGVPHTEVAMILADGCTVGFGYRVRNGDRIAVYPPFRNLAIEPERLVSPQPLPEPRFVLDGHLGKLARYLRLLGFDAVCSAGWTDPELVGLSTGQDRVLLTRDVGLLMHGVLTHGYYVRATNPRVQVVEVAHRFDLGRRVDAFTRCLVCNGALVVVAREEVADRLLPRTRELHEDFQECPDCGRVYWQGSHHAQLQVIVDEVTGKSVRASGDGDP